MISGSVLHHKHFRCVWDLVPSCFWYFLFFLLFFFKKGFLHLMELGNTVWSTCFVIPFIFHSLSPLTTFLANFLWFHVDNRLCLKSINKLFDFLLHMCSDLFAICFAWLLCIFICTWVSVSSCLHPQNEHFTIMYYWYCTDFPMWSCIILKIRFKIKLTTYQ